MLFRKLSRPMIAFVGCVVWLALLIGCHHNEKSEPKQPIEPDTRKQLERLNHTAEQMYRNVSEGQITEARDDLLLLEKQLAEVRLESVTTLEGAHALSETVISAMRVFNAVKFSMEDGQVAAAKIRLAADALTHDHQPMWLQYHKILTQDVDRLEAAAHGQQSKEALNGLELAERHFAIIKPAVLIQRDASESEKLQSLFAFLRTQLSASSVTWTHVDSGIAQLRDVLNELFNKSDQDAYVPITEPHRPVYWVVVMGAFIGMALTYTAWRMFQFDKNTVTIRRKPKDF